MYLFYMALGLNDFEVGNIHCVGHFKGWALNSQLFWVRMALAPLVAISGPKKVLNSGPTPSNGPRNGYCPPQNHYVPHHINNRYINSFYLTANIVSQ